MRMILPLLLALGGTGGGIAAGLALRPAAPPMAAAEDHGTATEDGHSVPAAEAHAAPEAAQRASGDHGATTGLPDYVKLSNQFVVPVVESGRVSAMVILSLSLEVTAGSSEAVYNREPKLRDAFLQVLFDHANVGGFAGAFTDGANLIFLRRALREAASRVLGPSVSDVLIIDIVRQDS